MKYDLLIVGAGLFGALSAYKACNEGKKVLVIDKMPYIGGFCHTDNKHGIEIHTNGAHVFRTNSRKAWDFVNSICEFTPFVNSPIAMFKGRIYNLPFNMNTFNQVFGVSTPKEAKNVIDNERKGFSKENLEEYAKSLIGTTLYEMFVKGYTEKQWDKPCSELPSDIIKDIPVRYTFNNSYYNEKYQGIPSVGYTEFMSRLLKRADVILNADFFDNPSYYRGLATEIVFTGPIDKFYGYRFGKLEYRSVHFEHRYIEETDNYQGNAVVNFTEKEVPYTRIIEHRHFDRSCNQKGTVVSYEYPAKYYENSPLYYPLRTESMSKVYEKYKMLSNDEKNIKFGGMLGSFTYYTMNEIIEQFV